MKENEKKEMLEKVVENRTPEQQKAFESYGSDYVIHATVSGVNRKFTDYFYPDKYSNASEALSAAWHFTNVYSKYIKKGLRRSVRVIPATAVKIQRFDQGRNAIVF